MSQFTSSILPEFHRSGINLPRCVNNRVRINLEVTMQKRVIVLFFCVLLLFFAVDARILWISLSEKSVQTAAGHGRYTIKVDTGRGTIYDRNLSAIVNLGVKYVAIVAPGINSEEQIDALSSHVFDVSVLKTNIEKGLPFTITVDSPNINVSGVTVVNTRVRYSEEAIAPHIVGYIDSAGSGVTGIEKSFDKVLKDYSGSVTVTYAVDAKRRALPGVTPTITKTGSTNGGVVLTIDRKIQQAAQAGADKYLKSGSVIVMDIRNGDILACVSEPEFSPLNVKAALNMSESPFVNKAFSAYNLGSVFKIAVSCAALESGISNGYKYTCSGVVDVSGRDFHCHKLEGHGLEDMSLAFANSCNPYFITIGLKTGADKLLEVSKKFGLGRQTVFAPGISTDSGSLPTSDELKAPAAAANFSMGEGNLMVTPVQVACMVSAVANGGLLPTPRLVKGIYDGNKMVTDYPGAVPDRVISTEIAEQVKSFMIRTVNEGTGLPAKPTYGGAGGKTATAETGWLKDGKTINHAWFAGFYPADSPRYAIVVMCENGSAGGTDAGPIFKYIADALAPTCGYPAVDQSDSSTDNK
nr:MAG: penicillin-binding protein 2 [[Clostridium] cellulosi]